MTNISLRVLHVEDSEQDVMLLSRCLTRAGYELFFKRVETADEMRSALESQEWDVILCDYSMPKFSALAALALVKEMKLDTPVIIISGTVGEALAVEAMRSGANDYLMKDNLLRLPPTIERVLQEAENHRARRRAEEALKTSETELRALFAAMTDLIVVIDAEGRQLKVAPSNPAYVYKTPAERIGKTLHEIFPKESADRFLGYIRRALAEGRTQRLEYSLPIEGRERWFEGTVSPMSVDSVIWIGRDITERKQAEQVQARLHAQLDDERRRLNNIIASVPGVVWEAWGEPNAGHQRIDFVSDYVKTMLGYSVEEWLSTPNFWLSIIHPDDKENAAQVAAAHFAEGRSQNTAEFRWITKDGGVIWAQSNYAVIRGDGDEPMGLRGVTIDITERKRAEEALRVSEEQLRQSQKLEAVGQLAGGVAHDFNNLLTVIVGYCDLTLMKLRKDERVRSNIEEVKKAADRAAALTRQLLAFSRRQVLQPKVLNLNAIVSDINKMLRRLIGEDIDLMTILDPSLGQINADPGQIEQVVINLAVNARDAMPQGGKLTFETANVYLDNEYVRGHTPIRPGNYVMFALSDTGIGMDAETQERIFEPFFTTKGLGKGTGLGLSTVYGIVKQSEGHIWVYSELGIGTTFKVYLPRVDDVAQVEVVPESVVDLPRGRETVLLTEDEEPVRQLVKTILESNGYEVLEATCGEEALCLFKEHIAPVHLIVTDVVMPRMSGRELAETLKTLRPDIKVLYLSGYTDDAIVRHGLLDQKMFFLQKPFTPDALLRKIHEVLAENSYE